MAENAVERRGCSIALACRAFVVSETCYRYSRLLSDESEQIADLLVRLTDARKTRDFVICTCATSKVIPGAISGSIASIARWN
jgi:putative transposase